ncbi:Peptidase M3A/M3B [Carpediemonas membranifera]|uniref:Peptidase M3A/M3B n=1 Tax=Carpediemonas membranifera TaxID=201153 RepID=A0A8J6E2F7_9EUKA|nr:Peptidase M3A/M3B [Carpediemonas membranifera]|eukprot:KAG9391852.1 Peptidase M3A/M3B [Carpediemonas membranifera]
MANTMLNREDKPATPHGYMRWDLNAAEIEAMTALLIKRDEDILNKVVAIPDAERTFANTFEPLIEDVTDEAVGSSIYQPSYISPVASVRDASFAAKKAMSEYGVTSFMRQDVYDALVALKNNTREYDAMHPEARRMLDKAIEKRERSGLGLPEAQREKVKSIRSEIVKLCTEFQEVVQNDDTRVPFTKEELAGMSDDFLESLTHLDDGRYEVTLKYPDIIPIARQCTVRETRKKMSLAKGAVGYPENLERMSKIVSLRAELAELLSFNTYADYRLADRMAKSADGVHAFYEDLVPRVHPAASKEAQAILARSKTEGDLIAPWDMSFYQREIEEEQFSVDHEALRKYFPMDNVLDAITAIVDKVLHIKLEKVPARVQVAHTGDARVAQALYDDMAKNGIIEGDSIAVWHEDAVPFKASDESGALLGYLIMDLHPRPHRYAHACMITLQPASHNSHAVIGLLANFPRPTEGKPACLRHSDVETLLHEVGHCLHDLSSETYYAGTSGTTGIEHDAVELPSQWFEGFAWDREALKLLGTSTDGVVISDAEIDNLLNSRKANKGLGIMRQVFFGQIDQYIHQNAGLSASDLKERYATMRAELTYTEEPAESCGLASFAHLVGGYDSAYYGYMWADVLAADCRLTGLDGEGGRKFRKEVLSRGGARDAADSVRAFLGRDANAQAMLKELGLVE